ncbi:hypothetical protein L798_03503 [Zootermopsis nevadensis]|uniref:Uncharacterized protein n=1 Tax=Zootermopsis nevadensis TaxID=136037 RepID=A0A067QQL2_ZOONE|nr:hypothetical protein L798_03503 [Zootermopsis nevadensis]
MFISDLFNDTVSSTNYIVSGHRMTSERCGMICYRSNIAAIWNSQKNKQDNLS